MSYIAEAFDLISAELPDNDKDLNELYALLALTTGESTTLQHVHEAWGVWRVATRPDHPALIPFADLTHEKQELDRPYRDAIVRAARKLRPYVPASSPEPA